MTADEALGLARATAAAKGRPWREPVRVRRRRTWLLFGRVCWEVWTNLVAFVVILIIATLRLAGVVARKPDAERLGYVIGEALVPTLIAAWAHCRYTKRKRAASPNPVE